MVLIADKNGMTDKELIAVMRHLESGLNQGHSMGEHNDLFDETGRCILCHLGVEMVISKSERL